MDKCLSEEIEEIYQLQIEASNKSFIGLWELPAKSLTAQGAEAAAEAAGAEWLAHLIPYLELADMGLDVVNEWREYNEFMNNLDEAKERRCKCIQDASN
jgi:hypothetical protein